MPCHRDDGRAFHTRGPAMMKLTMMLCSWEANALTMSSPITGIHIKFMTDACSIRTTVK